MQLKQEALGGGLTAFVSRAHSFGTDALLLADFARPKPGEPACDLGSGCGIIPLLWRREGHRAELVAVELQQAACAQIEAAVQHNRLVGQLQVLQADLRALKGLLPGNHYSLVSMNPPYQPLGRGLQSEEEAARLARHAVSCSFAEACVAAARLLHFQGRLCMCCRTQQLFSLMQAMQQAGVAPKRLRLVAKNEASAPWLVLLEGRKGGKEGLRVEPQLCLYAMDGTPNPALRAIYGAYAP